MINALIVDDERLARAELRKILQEFSDKITVIGEAADKRETVQFIESPENPRPDVIFLDINMPRGSGFDVLADIDYDGSDPIHIVFVTAYNKYAVRAFTVNALDYVLKPIDSDRLSQTLTRLETMLRLRRNAASQIFAESAQPPHYEPQHGNDNKNHDKNDNKDFNGNDDELQNDDEIGSDENIITLAASQLLTPDDYIFVTLGKQRRFVPVQKIICITASDNYTAIWLPGNKRAVKLRSMNEWQALLPAQHFIRIHRGTIINFKDIDDNKPLEMIGTSAQVYLRDIPEPFAVSRRYLLKLKERYA